MNYEIRSTFKIDAPKTVTIKGRAPGHPAVPPADEQYIFRQATLSDLFTWYLLGERSLYLTGPTGCGKSSVIIEVAARLSIPLWNVVAHSRLETPELIGGYRLNAGGGMDFVHGPLIIAMKEGGWFLIDEIDLLDPSTAAGLNGVAEGRSITIPETGEVVTAHPDFRFIATANSNGAGDATGLYQGILRQNLAFLDRFYMIEVGYPDPEIEKKILTEVAPSVGSDIRDRMVNIANEIRALFIKGEAEVTLSTRTLTRWARITAFQARAAASQGMSNGETLTKAFDRALGFRAEPDTRTALHAVLQRHFGDRRTP